MAGFEPNFDYKELVGRKVSVLLNDYTTVSGKLSLFGFKDKTVVIEDYEHSMNNEVFGKGRFMILKENFWCSIAVEPKLEDEQSDKRIVEAEETKHGR